MADPNTFQLGLRRTAAALGHLLAGCDLLSPAYVAMLEAVQPLAGR